MDDREKGRLREKPIVDALKSKLTALQKERNEMVEEVRNLINNSHGVDGLHLNGDIADWDWLLENWLPLFDKAISTLGEKEDDQI